MWVLSNVCTRKPLLRAVSGADNAVYVAQLPRGF